MSAKIPRADLNVVSIFPVLRDLIGSGGDLEVGLKFAVELVRW